MLYCCTFSWKMAGLLEIWPNVNVHSVIWFLLAMSVALVEIHHQLVEVYKLLIISKKEVWIMLCNLSKQSIVCLCLIVCWHLNRCFIWYCVKHCQRQFTSGLPKQHCLFYQAACSLFEGGNIEVLTIECAFTGQNKKKLRSNNNEQKSYIFFRLSPNGFYPII
jgi:hypothetical protein